MQLVRPGPEHLASYVTALERGWSADNERGVDAAREELSRIHADAEAFLASMEDELSHIELERERYNRLSELNVIQQVKNVCKTLIIRSAWKRNQALSVHGWIYNLDDGLVRDLQVSVSSEGELETLTQIYALH